MTKLLTPEQIAEIRARHDELHAYLHGKLGTIKLDPEKIHKDREALLSHIRALQNELAFLRCLLV